MNQNTTELYVLTELDLILSSKYNKNIYLLEDFFQNKHYWDIFHSSNFIDSLASHLEGTDLDSKAYSIIANYYNFKRKPAKDLSPSLQNLYTLVSTRLKENRKKSFRKSFVCLMFLTVWMIWIIHYDNRPALSITILLLSLSFGALVYKKLRSRHSFVVTQTVTLLVLNISNILILAFDMWTPLISNAVLALNIVVYPLLISILWIACLTLISILSFIFKLIHAKKIA